MVLAPSARPLDSRTPADLAAPEETDVVSAFGARTAKERALGAGPERGRRARERGVAIWASGREGVSKRVTRDHRTR